MDTIEIALPFPPSINHYWRMYKGRMIISADGQSYREVVWGIVKEGRHDLELEGRLTVEIDLIEPDHRRRDIDNTLKAILDALEVSGVYQDDWQIDDLRVKRAGFCKGKGQAIVRISEMAIDII